MRRRRRRRAGRPRRSRSMCRAASCVRFISATAASTTGGTIRPTSSLARRSVSARTWAPRLGQAETAVSGTCLITTPTARPTTSAALLRMGLARVAASATAAVPAPITTSETCAVSPPRRGHVTRLACCEPLQTGLTPVRRAHGTVAEAPPDARRHPVVAQIAVAGVVGLLIVTVTAMQHDRSGCVRGAGPTARRSHDAAERRSRHAVRWAIAVALSGKLAPARTRSPETGEVGTRWGF